MPWEIGVVMGPAKGGNKFVHLCASQMCHRKFMTESKVFMAPKNAALYCYRDCTICTCVLRS